MTANSGDLTDLTQTNLPSSSISAFVTGFLVEHIQIDNIFKAIKINVTEFIRSGTTGNKFYLKCRYLR